MESFPVFKESHVISQKCRNSESCVGIKRCLDFENPVYLHCTGDAEKNEALFLVELLPLAIKTDAPVHLLPHTQFCMCISVVDVKLKSWKRNCTILTCKMASEGFTEVDFTCPVCFDFFVNPVLLPCSHSICSDCIQAFWESKGIKECPMCREISTLNDLTLNLALKNMCEIFQQERSQRSSSGGENVCSAHKEKLNLFCLDDQQPICLVCRDSKLHTDHSFCPIDEAVTNNKVSKLILLIKPVNINSFHNDKFIHTRMNK